MNFDPSDLRDPQPPLPGEQERAKVAARAHDLGRRRRLVQSGGALALVAAVAVSVAALTAGGSSGPGGSNRVEAATASNDASATTSASDPTPASTTVAPAPESTPAPDGTVPMTSGAGASSVAPADASPTNPVAPVTPTAPVAPTTVTLSGTVTGNPPDTTVTLTLYGPSGPIEVAVDAAGNFSIGGLAPGDYEIDGSWYSTSGTAGRAQKLGSVSLTVDSSVNLVMLP